MRKGSGLRGVRQSSFGYTREAPPTHRLSGVGGAFLGRLCAVRYFILTKAT